jgi:hypothetical protein
MTGAQLLTLAVAFLVQAAPMLEQAALIALQALVELIPGPAKDQRNFLWGAHDIIRGIWADHLDWPEEQKRQYSRDAIVTLARDMMIDIDPTLFTILGLT